jgi:hypothetical protein
MYIVKGIFLNWKQTSNAEIHLYFHGYLPASPVVDHVTMDE